MNANLVAIRDAWVRAARNHHPDHHVDAGPAALAYQSARYRQATLARDILVAHHNGAPHDQFVAALDAVSDQIGADLAARLAAAMVAAGIAPRP